LDPKQHPGVSLQPGFAGSAYLTYVSLLNQAVMMSTQLYNDATNPSHHKYAAHQVALLYVSLGKPDGPTNSYWQCMPAPSSAPFAAGHVPPSMKCHLAADKMLPDARSRHLCTATAGSG